MYKNSIIIHYFKPAKVRILPFKDKTNPSFLSICLIF